MWTATGRERGERGVVDTKTRGGEKILGSTEKQGGERDTFGKSRGTSGPGRIKREKTKKGLLKLPYVV